MACNPCNDCTEVSYTLPDCTGEPCEELSYANCVTYKGPNLPGLQISNTARLKDVLITLNRVLGGAITAKNYTILVNSTQSATTVEYLSKTGYFTTLTVTSLTSPQVICAWENSPVVVSGTGYLIKGPIVYTSAAGATSNGTTVTVASTTGLSAGQTVFVYSGTGAFPANTTIASIVNATSFTVSANPTTALSGTNAVIKAYTTGSTTC